MEEDEKENGLKEELRQIERDNKRAKMESKVLLIINRIVPINTRKQRFC